MKEKILFIAILLVIVMTGCNKEIKNTEDEPMAEQTNIPEDNVLENSIPEENLVVDKENNIEVPDIPEKLAKSYLSIIESFEKNSNNDYKFKLAYINEDEIPELVIDLPYEYTGIVVSINDEVYFVDEEGNTKITDELLENLDVISMPLVYGVSRRSGYDYVPKKNIITGVVPDPMISYLEMYSLNGAKLELDKNLITTYYDELVESSASWDDLSNKYEENPDLDSLELKYYDGNHKIDEDTYNELTSDLKNSISLEENALSSTEMKECLSKISKH